MTKPTSRGCSGSRVSQPESEVAGLGAPDLLALTAEIVDIPSVSHREGALADAVESDLRRVAGLTVERIGDTVVARTDLGRAKRVLIAGHLDTVPGEWSKGAVLEGDSVRGLGASDMKGGLAVMLALAAGVPDPACDVTYVFYPCEEVGHEHNGLARLAVDRPDLLRADAAILGEPTCGLVEAGCQGTLHAVVVVRGARAHTARPFKGVNAVHRLAGVLERLSGYEPRRVVLDGCEYTEQLQAVAVEAGVAANVVPDEAILRVNFRFAPDRDPQGAVEELRRLIEPALDAVMGDSVEVGEVTAGAPPSLEEPVLAKLVAATGTAPRGKVGWTDVATFFANGVPAANFGPGDPLLAHTEGESVGRAALEKTYRVLVELLTG